MIELELLEKESIEMVLFVAEDKEVQIKYTNETSLLIAFGRGPVKYNVAGPEMEIYESNVVFEEDLATRLNDETLKAIDNITRTVFEIETDRQKETLLDLCDANTSPEIKDVLIFLAELHAFFHARI